MTHPNDIPEMEDALKVAGFSVARLCEDAGINQSTWGRWKRKEFSPNFKVWERVVSAYIALTNKENAA